MTLAESSILDEKTKAELRASAALNGVTVSDRNLEELAEYINRNPLPEGARASQTKGGSQDTQNS